MKFLFNSLTLVLAAAILTACNLPAAAPTAAGQPASTETPLPPTATSAPNLASAEPTSIPPTATSLPEPTFTPTSSVVTINAATGNLNIRRGPGLYYNVITSMTQGSSAIASGRDAQGYWLYVSIPTNPSAYGWVSTQTPYSTIQGDINTLPIMTAPTPLPAYIRNCTFHPMVINPGGDVMPPQTSAPANVAQFTPGVYTAADQSVMGSTPKELTLNEGATIDITVDGLNNVYACP